MYIRRQELIVYMNTIPSAIQALEKLNVTVQYVSKKGNYAVIYFNPKKYKDVIRGLKGIKGFQRYEHAMNELPSFEVSDPVSNKKKEINEPTKAQEVVEAIEEVKTEENN